MASAQTSVTIQFLGAAGTVTGSKFLLTISGRKVLIDCGLFQGLKELRLKNWDKLPIDASSIEFVLLTHGHLDHVGYLPLLVKEGFAGKIFSTEPTQEIAKIILEDSARIQEEDARQANEEGYSKHKPALPLYDLKNVQDTMPHFNPKPLNEWIDLFENVKFRFRYNGHIIGATFIELKVKDKVFVFSGDIGREQDPLMLTPERPEQANVLFIESTYGNRLHKKDAMEELTRIIKNAAQTKGTIIIPSFAVERTQLLMYILWQLRKNNSIPDIPIYLDSPMGKNVTDVFLRNLKWHKLSADDCREMFTHFISVQTVQETFNLAKSQQAKIVIAGSGMASGGRVLTYFKYGLGDANATIMLVGYQADGTRGRSLLEGAEKIKLQGKYYTVKASIENINGLSAHADQGELIKWMSSLKSKPEYIFLVHGEKEGLDGLKDKIKEVYGWDSNIPELFQTAEVFL